MFPCCQSLAGHKLVHSRALWGHWLSPLFWLLPPLGERKGGALEHLCRTSPPAWFLLSMGCGFISIPKGCGKAGPTGLGRAVAKERMDVWEPLNTVCAPGGEFAKLMEGRGIVSTAFNTGTSVSLPFPSPRCSEASTHRSQVH